MMEEALIAALALKTLEAVGEEFRWFADREGDIRSGEEELARAFIEAIERARREHPNR